MTTSISASLLSADFLHLYNEIKASEKAGVDSFHLDVMDAHLAPNLSYGPPVIKAIRQATSLPLETHLMIDNPSLFLKDYIDLDIQTIFIHVESYAYKKPNPLNIKEKPRNILDITEVDKNALITDLKTIQSSGIKAYITLNPQTPIACIKPFLTACDGVLFMSVNPGFSGQIFIPEVLNKIKALRTIFDQEIQVDGGINKATGPLAVLAGATTLITASHLYGSTNYKAIVDNLKL